MEIKIAVKNSTLMQLADLNELQGDLKSLSDESYKQLKSEIETTGFAFPVHVWRDKSNKIWIIGGHQRKRVLSRMLAEGFTIKGVPVVEVEAKDEREARRRVLQDVAQYGQVEKHGLKDFMVEMGLSLDGLKQSFKIPAISLDLSDLFPKQDLEEKEASSAPDVKHFLEVELSSEKELIEVYEELLSRGLIVRYK